jgi:hypothetical protein
VGATVSFICEETRGTDAKAAVSLNGLGLRLGHTRGPRPARSPSPASPAIRIPEGHALWRCAFARRKTNYARSPYSHLERKMFCEKNVNSALVQPSLGLEYCSICRSEILARAKL